MKNILIVEDSKVVNNLVTNELINLGYSCHQAFNFKAAEEFLADKKYDLIILDLHLPDGEGYELIEKVQNLTNTKVVILTGNTEKQLREELFHHGILDYIIKDKSLSYAITEIHKILKHLDSPISENILVIDDSAFICKQIQMILEPRNYNVTIAKTAKEGLEKLKNNTFDLVTLDMELPDMHGIEVLEKIKFNRKYIDLPVLVISGTTDSDIIRKVYKIGGSDFIRKPFIVEEFVLKVDLWCDYRKKHIEALTHKDQLLSQQSKMATMGEMLENIIHQSRQPLSTITTAASGISMEQEYNILTPEKLVKKIDSIINSATYLSDTMGSFKDFYKSNNKKSKFDLTTLLEKSFELTSSKFKNRLIDIITDFKKIEVIGYDIELLQVFINILNNARDEFEKHNLKNKYIFVTTKIDENNIQISFKDNAGGIPLKVINKVFDSHFTTKANEDGTGIGLFMSQEIIQKHHNGQINVQNEDYKYNDIKCKGAKFVIDIPLINN